MRVAWLVLQFVCLVAMPFACWSVLRKCWYRLDLLDAVLITASFLLNFLVQLNAVLGQLVK